MIHYLAVLGNITGLGGGSIHVKDRKALVDAHEMQFDDRLEMDRCQLRQKRGQFVLSFSCILM